MASPALYPVVANGNTYLEAGMQALGYVTALPAAISDVIAQAAKLYASTSSSTATIASSGSVTVTIATGRAFAVGQTVLCSSQAAPQTNFMTGVVTSYVTATGVLQFTANAAGGSGTFSAWYINGCSFNNSLGLTNANFGIVTSVLGTDQGSLGFPLALTTGNSLYDTQRGTAFLGIESPMNSMIEIFDDFLTIGEQYPASYYNTVIGLPWYSVNSLNPVNPPSGGTAMLLYAPSNLISAILTYGSSGGYLHIGKGAIVMEYQVSLFLISGGGSVGAQFSFGLSACGSSVPVYSIFGAGGIGFTVNTSGYFECVGGIAGQIQRVPTQIRPLPLTPTAYRCRVEIDHVGTTASYYINDVLMTVITGTLGTTGTAGLMMIAAEARSDLPLLRTPSLNIASFYLAKTLSR